MELNIEKMISTIEASGYIGPEQILHQTKHIGNPSMTWDAACLLPIIIGRELDKNLGVNFSNDYNRTHDGKILETGQLSNLDAYILIYQHVVEIMERLNHLRLEQYSGEYKALHRAMAEGAIPSECSTLPLCLPAYQTPMHN